MQQLTIEEKALRKARELGWKLIVTTNLPHPDDNYLIYTVIERKNAYTESGVDYATHLFNGSSNEFAYGHYDFKTFEDAHKDMKERAK